MRKFKLINIVILILIIISLNANAQKNDSLQIIVNIQDSLLKKDINIIVPELIFMYEYDQAIREYLSYATFNTSITDSIENLPDTLQKKYRDKNQLPSELTKKIYADYISPYDKKHTKRLIEITKKYGFPSRQRIKKYYNKELDEEFSPHIIFIHSAKEFWEELEILMTTEKEKGFYNKCQYGHLLWHIHGRKNIQYMLDNGFKFITDEQGRKVLSGVDCK
jgi:hypothetical protein